MGLFQAADIGSFPSAKDCVSFQGSETFQAGLAFAFVCNHLKTMALIVLIYTGTRKAPLADGTILLAPIIQQRLGLLLH